MTFWQTRLPATPTAVQVTDWIEARLAEHASWSKVDTITSGTATGLVWKCAGATTAEDFHLLIARNTGQLSSMFFAVFENYDPATDSYMRPVPAAGNTSPPAADYSLGGATARLVYTAAQTLSTELLIQGVTALVSGQPTDLYLAVTKTNFTITVVASSNVFTMVAGLFDTLLASGEVMPLWLQGTATTGGVSRMPFVTAGQTGNWQLREGLTAALAGSKWTQIAGALGADGDRLHNARPVASRVPVLHNGTSVAQANQFGSLRGLAKDALVMAGTAVLGDRFVINNAEYVAVTTATPLLLAVAAP